MAGPYLYDRAGKQYDLDPLRWRGDDGSPLMIGGLPPFDPALIDTQNRSIWRYQGLYAGAIARPLSLGEGGTPLTRAPIDDAEVWFKLDHLNPTGSFKDRGFAYLLSAIAQGGAIRLLEDSSGNGGSSFAAYATAGGLWARVLAPAATSPTKLLAMRAYGADVVLVNGDRDAVAAEALRQSEQVTYASHAWHPGFIEGVKSQAYEIWEDLGRRAPDTVVLVSGGGSQVIAHSIVWHQLADAGAIDRIPKLVLVQPANCAPLVTAYRAGADHVSPGNWSTTIAEGTAIRNPVRDREVLAALRSCDGIAVSPSEIEIAEATRRMATWGHMVEPTSANALAGYWTARNAGELSSAGIAVIVLTGSGFKASRAVLEQVFEINGPRSNSEVDARG